MSPKRMAALSATEFNQAYPVGTAVIYQPRTGIYDFVHTRTRSEAWTLGSGHPVVAVEGHSGGVSLQHLTHDSGEPSDV